MTNIAALLGYTDISFNAATRSFQPVNRAGSSIKKNKISVNKILPRVQNRLARLCKNPPKYDVRPESNSTEDKDAARLSLQTLTCIWDKLSLDQKRILLYMWVQQCGHAWVRVFWDPTEGRPMVDPQTGESGYEGEVGAEIMPPFEVFPDKAAKSQEDVLKSYLTVCKVRKLDYFKQNYPERGTLVKEEQAWLLSLQYEQRINSLNSRGPSQGGTQDIMKDSAIEMIRYEARSKNYPNGRMIAVANTILLEDKELPVGEIPFAKFDDIPVAGKLFSESVITHARPIQDQYNEVIRRRSDWTKRLLAGKYKAARGSGLAQESMNDESGEVVYYDSVPNSPGGPEALALPVIPQYAYTEEDRLNAQLDDIFGEQEIDRGTLPSASIPALGMQILTENSNTRIGIMTEQHEHSWARVGSLILKYAGKNYVMPRKLKMAGKSGSYMVQEVAGADLKGNTDVMVIRGSTLPGSKTLRRQEILNAYNQGLLGDPQDPKVREKVLSMLEYGDIAEAWKTLSLDESQIDRGIKKLETGMPVQLKEFDNLSMWSTKLNDYRKEEKFDELPPEIQNLIEETLEAAIQGMVQLAGGPPPPSPVSPDEAQAEAAVGAGAAPPPGQAPPAPLDSGMNPNPQPNSPQGGV